MTSQLDRISKGRGFWAALDQSGGSTPKALASYGIPRSAYSTDEQMFNLIHESRTRLITNPAFTSEHVLAAILFEDTLHRDIEGLPSARYLWEKKGIVPILKIDKGLAPEQNGVQLMKPIPGLEETLKEAKSQGVFGTKERSYIKQANPEGIRAAADQQFELGKRVLAAGLVPGLEPEVDIFSADRAKSDELLKERILEDLDALDPSARVVLKLSIPAKDNYYADLIEHPKVLRVVALSGGYSQAEANEHLKRNHGLIASFSRALLEGLSADQSEEDYTRTLRASIEAIYEASVA